MKHGTDRKCHSLEDKKVIRSFNKLWHESIDGTWHKTFWLGVKALKCPFDLWIYQELISEIKPALILETGTCFGGSALFMASVCEALGKGKVVTIDIRKAKKISHSRLHYIVGNSIEPSTLKQVDQYVHAAQSGPIIVILDSDHTKSHVLKELDAYHKYVTRGSYLIVEDTNLNADVNKNHGPGPNEAVRAWLPRHPKFQVDSSCEKFYVTCNPGGYLKRIK